MLGFWGGVGSMGTVFLLILLTQRCCCRGRVNKDETGRQFGGSDSGLEQVGEGLRSW